MEFKKEDENYVYGLIGKNIKKYRKEKGWTQQKLAEEINYSLSFISNLESKTHQTFSLGALWRIAQVLNIDMYKLCIDEDNKNNEIKYIRYVCDKCNTITNIPYDVYESIKNNNEFFESNKSPVFNCIKCDGKMKKQD